MNKAQNPEMNAAAETGLTRIRALFNDQWSVNVRAETGLGQMDDLTAIIFKKNAGTHITRHNADVQIAVMCHAHPTHTSKYSFELLGGSRLRETNSKFRKISAPSPGALMDKFIVWLKKFIKDNPNLFSEKLTEEENLLEIFNNSKKEFESAAQELNLKLDKISTWSWKTYSTYVKPKSSFSLTDPGKIEIYISQQHSEDSNDVSDYNFVAQKVGKEYIVESNNRPPIRFKGSTLKEALNKLVHWFENAIAMFKIEDKKRVERVKREQAAAKK